jgi:ABC-2 type transport system permease protein
LRALRLLVLARLRSLLATVFDRRPDRIARTATAVVVAGLFTYGGYRLFLYMFEFLARVPDVGFFLIDRLLSLGFLAFFLMLIVSNVITSLATLYRSGETSFLLATPLPHRGVFALKFADNLAYSSWAILILGVPLVAAYGAVNGFSALEYVAAGGLVLLPFVVIPACLGVMLSMGLSSLAARVRVRTAGFVLGALLVAAIVVYAIVANPGRLVLGTVHDYRAFNRYLDSMAASSFPFLPSFWAVEAFVAMKLSDPGRLLVYVFALVTTLFVALRGLAAMARVGYFRSWESFSRGRGRAAVVARSGLSLDSPFLRLVPANMRSLVAKDVRLFARETSQWAQFSILLVLLLMYLINLRPLSASAGDRFWQTVTSFANFGFTGYILATLSVRFVFPTISLEGRSFWAVGTSPVPLSRLLWQKFFTAFVIFFLIAEVVVVVSNVLLSQGAVMVILTSAGTLMMSVALVALSVGMGAVFPAFHERNPGRIASTVGGMLTIALSLLYVFLMVILVAVPTHRYTLHITTGAPFPTGLLVASLAALVVVNVVATYVPLRLGLRSLRTRDY